MFIRLIDFKLLRIALIVHSNDYCANNGSIYKEIPLNKSECDINLLTHPKKVTGYRINENYIFNFYILTFFAIV